MKNLTVRLSDLDHKRLTEQAIKKGGTVSDAMRDIVNQFFDKQGQTQNEKAEHEATRERVNGLAEALTVVLKANAEAAANQDKYLKAIYLQVAPKKEAQK